MVIKEGPARVGLRSIEINFDWYIKRLSERYIGFALLTAPCGRNDWGDNELSHFEHSMTDDLVGRGVAFAFIGQ